MNRTMIVGAVTAAALAVGGGAFAATQLGGPENEQAILDDAAKRLGVDSAELKTALQEAFAARIDAAVAAGRLTQEQGAAIKQHLEEGGLFGGGPPGFHPGMRHRASLDAVATYLGQTEAEVRSALQSGKSLADLATAAGKSIDGLKKAMIDAATRDLETAVSDGHLTEQQKQRILEHLQESIDAIVNGEFGPGGPGGPPGPWGGPDGPGGGPWEGPDGGGWDGTDDADPGADTTNTTSTSA